MQWRRGASFFGRSEEHTSELQSRENLVCRLLREKKNNSLVPGERVVTSAGSGLSNSLAPLRAKVIFCSRVIRIFLLNDTATTEIYTLSLHDALPIQRTPAAIDCSGKSIPDSRIWGRTVMNASWIAWPWFCRSEEHTSELQSREN